MDPEPIPPHPDPRDAPANDIRPDPRAKAPARITVIDVLYYQPAGRGIEAQPSCVEARFSRELRSDERLYERTGRAGPDWRPLPLPGADWIDPADCGALVLRNLEGTDVSTVQTPEELRGTAALGILVGVEADGGVAAFARVRPGESLRLEPLALDRYRLRCPGGPARFTLTLAPG